MLLGVYMAIHDLLLDDDEDVRDKAAAVASKFLPIWANTVAIPKISLLPPAANSILLRFLKTEFNKSLLLFTEGARRLTDSGSSFRCGPLEIAWREEGNYKINSDTAKLSELEWSPSMCIRPVRESMQEAIQQDNTLFAIEKQNLFLDLASEAESWALILMNSDPVGDVVAIISAVENWATQGLEVLIETATSQEDDGPLGWTTKTDVFTLGMRILQGVKVLIHWLKPGLKGKTSLNDVYHLLHNLQDIGTEKLMNEIWLQQIENLLVQETT